MLKSALKAYAYSRAPKTTFAVLHPEEAFQLKKLPYDLKHAYAPRLTAGAVLLLALPLGIVLGRALERRRFGRARRRRASMLRPPLTMEPRTRREGTSGGVLRSI